MTDASKVRPGDDSQVVQGLIMLKLTNTSHFSNDLGLDSLDTVEVVMAIEEV